VCTEIDNAHIAYQAGFDYIECPIESLKPQQAESEVKDIISNFLDSPIPVEAFNIFMPSELKITGNSVDYNKIKCFVENALERVSLVGGETIVFGSGGARAIPEGFSREKSEEQIVYFLDLVADYADKLGITIVIEPLYKKASNIIHTIPEAVEIAKKVNRKSIKILSDFFHMMEEKDSLDNIVKYKQYIGHIHVSDNYHAPGTGQYPFLQFVNCVKEANYDGKVSIECIWDNFEIQATNSLQYVKKHFLIT